MEHMLFSEPLKAYKKMLEDIDSAKDSVFLETYIYGNDEIGRKFRDLLTKKAKQGVDVRLLIDAWGSQVNKEFFSKFEAAGGKVKFFRELIYVVRWFDKNHERNHRKLLVIDNNITYVGSANITKECINWRELILRVGGKLSWKFQESFLFHWNLKLRVKKRIKTLMHKGFEIINDNPSDKDTFTEKKYLRLIKRARKEILIETPYFVPSLTIRKALYKAVKRGVVVKILLPKISDVRITDIVRNRYLGTLHKHNIKIYYYLPKLLHSKLLIVDKTFFLLGSSNLDYRSFLHQYEINLFGNDKKISSSLIDFYNQGIKNSKEFNYKEWRSRSAISEILELVFSLISNYL